MDFTRKQTALAALLVTSSGWLVLGVCSQRADAELAASRIEHCEQQAGQIAGILGERLLRDDRRPPDPSRADAAVDEAPVRQALDRVLSQSGLLRVCALVELDGRTVVVHESRRRGTALAPGTPVELQAAGHRARRTGTVQSVSLTDEPPGIIRTFAPIHGGPRGLLIVDTAAGRVLALGSTLWLGICISALAGITAAALLRWRIGRPLERLRRQLSAAEVIAPADSDAPAGVLEGAMRCLERARSERGEMEARLRQQILDSESRIRLKDEMVADTVHELRTPLTSIIASMELMISHRRDMTDDEQREFLGQATTAGKHMMFLVNDLLDSAAIEAGKIHMEIEECLLQRLLIDAKRSMEMVAAARGMILQVSPIDPGVMVRADCARVMQIIFNLISNAVKYSPAGGTVALRAQVRAESAVIEIEDEGEGIALAMRSRLFTKFGRLHADSDYDDVQSSGIGLYLSKKLVERMHGSIGYRERESGLGSVFWFTLPIATATAPCPGGVGALTLVE